MTEVKIIMSAIKCPECGGMIQVAADAMLGEVIECFDCSAELEIISLSPLSVELAPEIEEDWGE